MNQSSSSAAPTLSQTISPQGILQAFIAALVAEFTLGSFVETSQLDALARVTTLFITLYVVHRFSITCFRSYKPRFKDTVTITMLLIGAMLLVWVGRVISISVAQYFSSGGGHLLHGLQEESLYFALPFAAGGMVLRAVLGLHYGMVYALSLALGIAVYFPGHPILALYVLSVNLVACLSLTLFRSRAAYTKAGLNVVIISLPFALCSIILEPSLTTADIVTRSGGVLLNGALCISLAAGVTPIVEYLGGYVTDMRLIEMATLDHPLLKELSIQAPGTWNHSMVMGMMVESAADAIGANAVVARVGAYFHDIGKMKKPLYFVENQVGENRHDKLSSSMSALIIRSHVKDGIELARKHTLPQIIEDMIPQHHGTSLIEYFFDKAQKEAKEADENAPDVDRSLYTYPGPRPQTKEAGILMLADGIEAASRTVNDPTHDRIQGLVQKLINKVFASGELDECELTLKDLHAIAKSFTRVLTGIYHQRIAYAEPAEKISEKSAAKSNTAETPSPDGAAKDVAGGASSKKVETSDKERSAKEDNKEDLKRLGL